MKPSYSMSRREMFRLMGAGVVGAVAGSALSMLPTPAQAQGTTAAPKPIGFFSFQVGDLEVTVI